MKLSDLPTKPPKILDWGPMGTGKTARALTLGARAQIIDVGEDGLITGKTLVDKFQKDRLAVDVMLFRETKLPTKAHAFNDTRDYIFKVSQQCHAGTFPFDALILDSLTELARMSINQVLSNNSALADGPQIQHYGLAFAQTKMVLDVLKSLPIVVYVIGHDQRDAIVKKSVDGKKVLDQKDFIELAVTGKNMPAEIPRGFDEVWYSHVRPAGGGKSSFLIQTAGDELVKCRTRGQIPNMLDTTELGMWDIIKRLGYTPPERTPAPATT